MTDPNERLPRPHLRVVGDDLPAPKLRPVQKKRTTKPPTITKKLTKWLRKKPKRAAYWTGVLHGAAGALLVVGASLIVSALGTVLLVVGVLAIAFVLSRR